MTTTTRTITIPSQLDPVAVFGPVDEVIRQVEHAFPDLTIIVRGDRVAIVSHSKSTESQASRAEDVIHTIIQPRTAPRWTPTPCAGCSTRTCCPTRSAPNTPDTAGPPSGAVRRSVQRVRGCAQASHTRRHHFRGRAARACQDGGQIAYVNAVDAHTITFAIGPAGTGKTYLAVAKAVRAFQDRRIRRIILTRPAVEAGESLGFLPGTLNDKVDPYLRPLYDALSDMLGPDQLHRYLDDGTIEVAPLAYMRGRTLNDAYVILDEAQNTTEQQMKMFLTRLGFNTTMIITGDVTQVDLAVPRSGLATIEGILGGIDDIAFAHLDAGDVVRHELVGRIVEAYDRHDATRVRRNRGKESREDAR